MGEENSKMNLNLEIKYFLVIKKITFSICDYSRPKLKFTLSQNTGENFIFQAGHFWNLWKIWFTNFEGSSSEFSAGQNDQRRRKSKLFPLPKGFLKGNYIGFEAGINSEPIKFKSRKYLEI